MFLQIASLSDIRSACTQGSIRAGFLVALCLGNSTVRSFETDPGNPNPNGCLAQLGQASLTASALSVVPGQSTVLSWMVQVPSICGNGLILDISGQLVGHSGTLSVPIASTRTLTLSATFSGTRVTLANVTITAEYPLPSGRDVRIEGSSPAHAILLQRALAAGGKRIALAPDVDLDMTGRTLTVAANTVLTGDGARDASHPGPRIRTSDRPKPLILIRCFPGFDPDARVSLDGFRLQGPHWHPESGASNLERGIMIESCRGVSISNMEIYGWSGQGIYISDSLGQINYPEDVRIFDNFFHHNQHEDGNGYGVESTHGARALIERNVFDFNRHAIAAGGGWSPGAGYIARHNLILKGGGYHRSETWPHPSWQTHQLDVHGTTACGPLVFDAEYSCGEAGVYFEYSDNVVQYTRGAAIKIRGNPVVNPLVKHNIFARVDSGDAIKQNGWNYESAITSPIIATDNLFGSDAFGRYGVCDMDGDGTDDLFMATGANWWWSSAGKRQWTFLRAAHETIDQVLLGDFDGDGRCDVIAAATADKLELSSGGRASWSDVVDRTGQPVTAAFEELRVGDFNGDGRADFFQRDSSGQWRIISPGVSGAMGVFDWTPIQTSALPLSALRFGHFNQDRITDVIAVQDGKWSVSWGGVGAWQRLGNYRSERIESLLFGDLNKNGIDDAMRYRWLRNQSPIPGVPGGDQGIWEVCWESRCSNWVRLDTYTAPTGAVAPTSVPAFVGKFEGGSTAVRLLTIPTIERTGMAYDPVQGMFRQHSQYAY